MADGRDDNVNFPARRGSKLRNQGSNPTGDQTMSFTPGYSDEMDYSIGATALNKRVRMSEDQQIPKKTAHELRGETGLIFKEPLS